MLCKRWHRCRPRSTNQHIRSWPNELCLVLFLHATSTSIEAQADRQTICMSEAFGKYRPLWKAHKKMFLRPPEGWKLRVITKAWTFSSPLRSRSSTTLVYGLLVFTSWRTHILLHYNQTCNPGPKFPKHIDLLLDCSINYIAFLQRSYHSDLDLTTTHELQTWPSTASRKQQHNLTASIPIVLLGNTSSLILVSLQVCSNPIEPQSSGQSTKPPYVLSSPHCALLFFIFSYVWRIKAHPCTPTTPLHGFCRIWICRCLSWSDY